MGLERFAILGEWNFIFRLGYLLELGWNTEKFWGIEMVEK